MPPKTSLEDIHESIGGLKAQVTALAKDTVQARESRGEIHEKLEKLGIEMVRVNNSVKTVTTQVATMQPIVTDYEKLRQNINGGLLVIGGIGAVLFTTIGFFAKELWSWITAHMHG